MVGIIAAPAIVRVESLMPVRSIERLGLNANGITFSATGGHIGNGKMIYFIYNDEKILECGEWTCGLKHEAPLEVARSGLECDQLPGGSEAAEGRK